MKKYDEISAEEANEWKLQHSNNLRDLDHQEFEKKLGIEKTYELSEDGKTLHTSVTYGGVSSTTAIFAVLIVFFFVFLLGYSAVEQFLKGEYVLAVINLLVTVAMSFIGVRFLKTARKKIQYEKEYKKLVKKGMIEKEKFGASTIFTAIYFIFFYFIIGFFVLLWVLFLMDEKFGII